jgi:hypothetical protein
MTPNPARNEQAGYGGWEAGMSRATAGYPAGPIATMLSTRPGIGPPCGGLW